MSCGLDGTKDGALAVLATRPLAISSPTPYCACPRYQAYMARPLLCYAALPFFGEELGAGLSARQLPQGIHHPRTLLRPATIRLSVVWLAYTTHTVPLLRTTHLYLAHGSLCRQRLLVHMLGSSVATCPPPGTWQDGTWTFSNPFYLSPPSALLQITWLSAAPSPASQHRQPSHWQRACVHARTTDLCTDTRPHRRTSVL